MKGSEKDSTPSVPEVSSSQYIPNPPNAFTPEFLKRVGERDEPLTAGEADMAGPWQIEEIPGSGWGLFRLGEGSARRFRPFAVFRRRSVALLAAAILPGTGRDAAFRLQVDPELAGYAVVASGELVGHLALFDDQVIAGLHVAEMLVRSPESLARLLEAAGAITLERAGAILDLQVAGPEGRPAPD